MKIPKGWNTALLHELAHVQTGLSKSEGRTGPSVRKPYLRVANVQDGFLDLSELKQIDVPVAQVERFRLQMHDVLLTEGGDFDKLGRGCVWRNEVPDCVHQNHIFAVRITNPQAILPQFFACQIQSAHAKNYFMSCSKQTTNLASINSGQIKKLPVLLPPLLEQQGIVHAASIWDSAIEKSEKLISIKERALAALAHQLLSARKRLKGFAADWRYLRADGIFDNVSVKGTVNESLLSVTQDRGVIPRDMLSGRVTMPSSGTNGFKLVEIGNFVISLRSFQGGLEHSEYRGLVSPAYTVLAAKQEIVGRYFRHYFRSADFIKRLSVAVIGIRDGKQVSFDDFCSIKLPFPLLEEQRAIAAVLDTAEHEIALLRKLLAAFQQQKRGLMQKLLSGQWQVKTPTTEAA